MKDEIVRRQTRRHGMDKGTESLVEKLKKEYQYTPDKVGMDELLAKGQTEKKLFTLGGREYTGQMFANFAIAHPQGIQRQLKGFIMKSVLDYEYSRLEQKYPEFRMLMQEYRDGMLLFESVIGKYGNACLRMRWEWLLTLINIVLITIGKILIIKGL